MGTLHQDLCFETADAGLWCTLHQGPCFNSAVQGLWGTLHKSLCIDTADGGLWVPGIRVCVSTNFSCGGAAVVTVQSEGYDYGL